MGFLIDEFVEEAPIILQQSIKAELVRLMAGAIINVLDNERQGKSDDNLSEQ